MKKKVSVILASLLIALLAIGLCACGESAGGGEKETTAAVETKAPEKETTAAAETVVPIEKETTAAAETVVPVSGDSKIPDKPLVSDDTHFVIDQGDAILSYEYKGNDICGCVCYIDTGAPEYAIAAAESINNGEGTEEYDYEVLGAFAYENYVGIRFGSEAWEGIDIESLQIDADLGVFTKLE